MNRQVADLPHQFLGNISVTVVSDLKEVIEDPENLPKRIKKKELLKEKIYRILETRHYDCDDILLGLKYAESITFDCT